MVQLIEQNNRHTQDDVSAFKRLEMRHRAVPLSTACTFKKILTSDAFLSRSEKDMFFSWLFSIYIFVAIKREQKQHSIV